MAHFRTSEQLEKVRSGALGTLRNAAVTFTSLSLTQVNNFLMGEKGGCPRANRIRSRKRKERDWKGEDKA